MINDIKAKLPSKKKADDEELDENEGTDNEDATDPSINLSDKTSSTDIRDLSDDEEEESDEPQSLIDKLKAKFAPKKKAAAGDKKTAKKKVNPIVLAVVAAALIFLFLGEDEPEETVVAPTPAYKSKKVPVKPAEPAVTETPADPTVETSPTDAPTETVTDPNTEPSVDAAVDAADSTISEPTVEGPVITEPVIDEPVVTDVPPESVDSVDGQVPTDDSSMTDKILEDLEKQVKKDQPKEVKKEYVAPPDYEYKGRGLVYNCAGKHWACVDAPSYKTCEDNHSSVTFKNKKIECYPFNVYESTRGCEAMQNRVVSSNAKTAFCK